jgi:ATP-dependent Clp protease ATP-binding subunit ClpB
VELQIRRVQRQLEQNGLRLEVTEAAINAIAAQGYDPTYGARPLKRVIQQRIQNPLATEQLKGQFSEGDTIRVDYTAEDFTFERVGEREPVGSA